jgi:hypothetical protein
MDDGASASCGGGGGHRSQSVAVRGCGCRWVLIRAVRELLVQAEGLRSNHVCTGQGAIGNMQYCMTVEIPKTETEKPRNSRTQELYNFNMDLSADPSVLCWPGLSDPREPPLHFGYLILLVSKSQRNRYNTEVIGTWYIICNVRCTAMDRNVMIMTHFWDIAEINK